MIPKQVFMIWYEDDGPNGICGQNMSVTRPWAELLIFYTYNDMRAFCEKALKNGRKNPRVTPLTGLSIITGNQRVAASQWSPTWDGVDLEEMFRHAEENK